MNPTFNSPIDSEDQLTLAGLDLRVQSTLQFFGNLFSLRWLDVYVNKPAKMHLENATC